MSNETTFQGGSVHWAARILLDAAEPILRSADINQALRQSETDANKLRALLAANAHDLICSSQTPDIVFVENLILPPLATKWRRSSAIIIAALVIFSVLAHLTFPHVCTLVIGTALVSLIYILLFSGRMPLEPTQDTLDILQREVVGPYLRAQINRILAEQPHIDTMRVTRAPGLDELSELDQLVSTDTMYRLGLLSRTMSAGSIGISGPRGVGKTTLLRALCDPSLRARARGQDALRNTQDLGIMIAAPVEYSTKDFIMHLFCKLCETVIYSNQTASRDNIFLIPNRRARKLSFLLLGCLLAVLGIGMVASVLLKSKHLPKVTSYDVYLTAGSAAIAAGIIILVWQLRTSLFSRWLAEKNKNLIDQANSWLIRIRYMQTLTMGHGGSMKVPGGPEINITTTQQLAELQLTLPDLVDRYKEFALQVIQSQGVRLSAATIIQARKAAEEERASITQQRVRVLFRICVYLSKLKIIPHLATRARNWSEELKPYLSEELESDLVKILESYSKEYHGLPSNIPAVDDSYSGSRLVIGIDEIDKMSAESAERFLGDIKAIFGIPHCIYLVSVSDEALAMFEQRVLLGRTAFDSTFDEVVRARELDFVACRDLLRQRIAGIPDSLIAFSQVMSGGLPRDLIRVARTVVEACAEGETQIVELVLSVVNSEISILKKSFVVKIAEVVHSAPTGEVIEYLLKDDRAEDLMTSLHRVIETEITDTNQGLSFCAALYFYGTVAEVFGSKLSETSSSLRSYRADDEAQTFSSRCRRGLNAALVWLMVSV